MTDTIIDLALSYNFWIYGGWIRDVVCHGDKTPHDIDIMRYLLDDDVESHGNHHRCDNHAACSRQLHNAGLEASDGVYHCAEDVGWHRVQ